MFVFGLFECFWCIVMKCVRDVCFRAIGIAVKYEGVWVGCSMLVASSWCIVVYVCLLELYV